MHTKGKLKVAATFVENQKPAFGVFAKSENPKRFNGELVATFTNEYDAMLFAAAPELLEALKTLLFNAEHGNGYEAIQQGRAAARAAIAKATGNA